MVFVTSNPWRTLARELKLPATGPVVRIYDLGDKLTDTKRFNWDQGAFTTWFKDAYRGVRVDPRAVYPEWRFNFQVENDGSGFTKAGRNSFLCVYSKFKALGLWKEIESIRWVGATGEIAFVPTRGVEGLRRHLKTIGFGDWWLASHNCPWGLRSRYQGVELHFRGVAADPDLMNGHIDIHNPGDPPDGASTNGILKETLPAIDHWWKDDENRQHTHKWWILRGAVIDSGVMVPSLGDRP